MTKYKRGSAWKRTHWDRWGFWRKVLHVLAVIASLITCLAMVLVTGYVVLVIFGVYSFLEMLRDKILLGFAHWLFD